MVHANVRRLVLQSLGTASPECGICLEPFAHADATVMECCHLTCRDCFNQLRKRECPFCRHKFAPNARTTRENSREITLLRRDVAMLNNEVNYLERENEILLERVRDARPRLERQPPIGTLPSIRTAIADQVYTPTDPVYMPYSPPYQPRSPVYRPYSPAPPPPEWEERTNTPLSPRTLFVELSSDSDSDSLSDTEILDIDLLDESPVHTTPTVPRSRAPCRCSRCSELGHQRNNRRFHPTN